MRSHLLGIFFGVILLLALVGQAVAGHAKYNDDEIAHAQLRHEAPQTVSLGRYVTSSDFANAVMENWQSEYLQFFLYLYATIWFVQRGSPESKQEGQEGRESEEEQGLGRHASAAAPGPARRSGGFLRALYSNSLGLVMLLVWLGSWFAQSITGRNVYNANAADHAQHAVSWVGYLGTADFWESTLQNWQSEFLAVGSFAVLAVYLRQRGSPESKPVGAAHQDTGVTG